eukprot:TRINITY_DN3197_c0_g1_i2.p1 TRINITY_DN3197_c0_g1~~TRINITY_DN3197_c0_g1_i2.p1  ORF type:complete len:520 (+),score=200.33 TRINITY_DN3197_c0_g1_i2:652-2211(+)
MNHQITEERNKERGSHTSKTPNSRRRGRKKKDVTIPIEPKFMKREKAENIRERKVKEMVLEKIEEEENALNFKFRAKSVPPGISQPFFETIMKNKEEERLRRKEEFKQKQIEAEANPFYERLAKKVKKEPSVVEQSKRSQFRAKPAPMTLPLGYKEQVEKEEQERRRRLKERAEKLAEEAKLPSRMEDASKKPKKQLEYYDKDDCTFKPKIKKELPDFKKEQENFDNDLKAKKESRPKTEQEEFALSKPRETTIKVIREQAKREEEEKKPKKKVGEVPDFDKEHDKFFKKIAERRKAKEGTSEKGENEAPETKPEDGENVEEVKEPEGAEKGEEVAPENSQVERSGLKDLTKSATKAFEEEKKEKLKEYEAKYGANKKMLKEYERRLDEERKKKEEQDRKEKEQQDRLQKIESMKPKVQTTLPHNPKKEVEDKQKELLKRRKEDERAQKEAYEQKIREMNEKLSKKPLLAEDRLHGAKGLAKYRELAKQAMLEANQAEQNNEERNEVAEEIPNVNQENE